MIIVVYILASETITVVGAGADDATIATDRNIKKEIFKTFTLFTNCIAEINNTQRKRSLCCYAD